jgi:hypothetical protein
MTMAATEQNSRNASDPAQRWLLKYADRIYGPYSQEAMIGYIGEGRVIAASLIAPDGTGVDDSGWTNASEIAVFASYFNPPASEPAVETTTPVAEMAAPHGSAAREPETDASGKRPVYGAGKGQTDRRRQPETANFIIVMDIKARYTGPLEQAIMSLGPAYKLAPNVWCVNADSTAAGLLNDLSIHIGKTDSMFIVDATRDRTAWHNLGPETDAKIRRVWRRAF